MDFCQSTYDAAADCGKWDRAALERGKGRDPTYVMLTDDGSLTGPHSQKELTMPDICEHLKTTDNAPARTPEEMPAGRATPGCICAAACNAATSAAAIRRRTSTPRSTSIARNIPSFSRFSRANLEVVLRGRVDGGVRIVSAEADASPAATRTARQPGLTEFAALKSSMSALATARQPGLTQNSRRRETRQPRLTIFSDDLEPCQPWLTYVASFRRKWAHAAVHLAQQRRHLLRPHTPAPPASTGMDPPVSQPGHRHERPLPRHAGTRT